MSLLQKTLGPEFSQLHMLRPHDYAVCQQGPLWRLTEAGLLVKRTKRYCYYYCFSNTSKYNHYSLVERL
jgi:hypothetical protein